MRDHLNDPPEEYEEELESWDGEHCPQCGSTDVVKTGDTKGENTGDSGIIFEVWQCGECGWAWHSEMQDGAR